uniref:Uncharacterized protein n=1 Tax=Vitrella brassicaformis TaxID=1169539 RepID=A0A7S1JKE7_9ALVE
MSMDKHVEAILSVLLEHTDRLPVNTVAFLLRLKPDLLDSPLFPKAALARALKEKLKDMEADARREAMQSLPFAFVMDIMELFVSSSNELDQANSAMGKQAAELNKIRLKQGALRQAAQNNLCHTCSRQVMKYV